MQDSEFNANFLIGNRPIIKLNRPRIVENKPQFLQAIVLPGIGMNLLQIKAYIPNLGEIDLLHSPTLENTKLLLENPNNIFGNRAFTIGSALLIPYANRIRGKSLSDGKSLSAHILGKEYILPANWQSSPIAEKHAMHGLIYDAQFDISDMSNLSQQSRVAAQLSSLRFNQQWPASADIKVEVTLNNEELTYKVTVKNSDKEILPLGIGLHPYFNIPSQERQQVKLHLPASHYVVINNYQDVFPTGQINAVKNTAYDFTSAAGRKLHNVYLDDCFVGIQRDAKGIATATIFDERANYGLKIKMLSPEIKAIQVYAPPHENFIAIEPQFNVADPFSDIWGSTDTGMVFLKPGEAVVWQIALELASF